MDVAQPALFLTEFFPQVESLRDRARANPVTIDPEQSTQVIVPIEEQSSDFFVIISPEAQLLQQAANAQEERRRAFTETTGLEAPPANEFVSVTTSIGRSRRFGGLTSSEAIAIYRFIDTLR